jgi:3-hydroxyacyl-[acyl-carrier-protein] dehydratase
MRWIWIDKFTHFESRTRAVAVKNCSLAEEHLHDLYPAFPIMPHSLIIEGMAQTAGILVGEARGFKEKVILAKVGRATFHRLVRPGSTILYDAVIEQLNDTGASITGQVRFANHASDLSNPQSVQSSDHAGDLVAEIEIMFSHIDQNLAGTKFPEHNFVFTDQFTELLQTYRSGLDLKL